MTFMWFLDEFAFFLLHHTLQPELHPIKPNIFILVFPQRAEHKAIVWYVLSRPRPRKHQSSICSRIFRSPSLPSAIQYRIIASARRLIIIQNMHLTCDKGLKTAMLWTLRTLLWEVELLKHLFTTEEAHTNFKALCALWAPQNSQLAKKGSLSKCDFKDSIMYINIHQTRI